MAGRPPPPPPSSRGPPPSRRVPPPHDPDDDGGEGEAKVRAGPFQGNPLVKQNSDEDDGGQVQGAQYNNVALQKKFGVRTDPGAIVTVEGEVDLAGRSMQREMTIVGGGTGGKDIMDYGNKYFLLKRRRKMGGTKVVDAAKLLTHAQHLRQPLHAYLWMGDDPTHTHTGPGALALTCFEWLMVYLRGSASAKRSAKALNKMCTEGLREEKLRDEIYCQIIKQSRIMDNSEIVDRCYRALALVAGIFPCSERLAVYLEPYLKRVTAELRIGEFGLAQLRSSLGLGSRVWPPISFEIAYALAGKRCGLSVGLPDGTDIKIEVGSQTTIDELIMTVSDRIAGGERLMMNNLNCLGIFDVETYNGVSSRPKAINGTGFVLDVLAGWMNQEETLREANYRMRGFTENDDSFSHKLVFQARFVFYYLVKRDTLFSNFLHLLYAQGVRDIVNFQCPCTETQAYEFAALQLIVEQKSPNDITSAILGDINKYMPKNHVDTLLGLAESQDDDDSNFKSENRVGASPPSSPRGKPGMFARIGTEVSLLTGSSKSQLTRTGTEKTIDTAQLESKKTQVAGSIAKVYGTLKGILPEEAIRRYLDILLKLPLYGMIVYDVTWLHDLPASDWNFEGKCPRNRNRLINNDRVKEPRFYNLGISEKGILFVSVLSKKLRKHHALHQITKCDHDPTHFYYYWGDPSLPSTSENAQRVLAFKTNQAEEMCYMVDSYQRRPGFKTKFD